MEEERDRICREGTAAWKRLKKGKAFDDYVKVGRALELGRKWAMDQAKTNEPVGRAYNFCMGEFLERYRLLDMDKADRSRLMDMMDNLIQIEEWRRRLTGTERQRMNHPSVVLRKWRADTKVGLENSKKKKRPTMRDSLIELDEKTYVLEQRIAAREAHIRDLEAARQSQPQTHGEWVAELRPKSREERVAAVRDIMHQLDLQPPDVGGGEQVMLEQLVAARHGRRNGNGNDDEG
jgi:hypothetical protein